MRKRNGGVRKGRGSWVEKGGGWMAGGDGGHYSPHIVWLESGRLPADYHQTTTGKLYEFSYNFPVAVWWLSHQTISPTDFLLEYVNPITSYCIIMSKRITDQ